MTNAYSIDVLLPSIIVIIVAQTNHFVNAHQDPAYQIGKGSAIREASVSRSQLAKPRPTKGRQPQQSHRHLLPPKM